VKRLDLKISEKDRLKGVKLVDEANSTPAIALGSADALSGRDFASLAWERVHNFISEMAVKHDLPEDTGPYGIDFTNGQFIQ